MIFFSLSVINAEIMSKIDLGMDFQMPKNQSSQIKVMGIGGGGSNAVNYMFENGITGVDFVICNTDSQALEASSVPIKIQLGANLTEGLGAGSNPEIGRKAAEESQDKIVELLDANTKMLFLTAGMGGGTGTGAAPVIAEIAKEKGILTVGVVTNPFKTEGGHRKKYAEEGVRELKKYVDTLLIINNDKLIEVYGDLTFTQAFAKANEILNTATKGIAEVISEHLLVNIDLNDARKVLENSGTAVMGQSTAEGENRAMVATEMALNNPLIDEYSLQGAKGLLINITGGNDLTLFEVDQSVNKIRAEVDPEAELIFGAIKDESMTGKIRVSIVATALDGHKTENKTVLNMFSRVQNRNSGYSENLFSQNSKMENNTLSSIDGATALKLDESYQLDEEEYNHSINNIDDKLDREILAKAETNSDMTSNDLPTGLSIESASYMENNNLIESNSNAQLSENEAEYTPKLFSDEESHQSEETIAETDDKEAAETEQLFEKEINEEEDFEIPAFLRKQKF